MPSRRSLLRSSALALPSVVGLAGCLAGCLGSDGNRAADRTPTARPSSGTPEDGSGSPTGTRAPTGMGVERTVDGLPVAVSNPTAQRSVVHLTTPDSMDVTRAPDGRFVLVDVRVGHEEAATPPSGAPRPERFALRLGDAEFPGTVALDDVGITLPDRATKYDPSYGTSRGWVAFSLPAPVEAARARVEVGEVAWWLPERVVDTLGRPLAAWELGAVGLPVALSAGEPFEVTVTVRNAGDVAGRFRGVLNTAGVDAAYAPHPFVLDADPGEERTWVYRGRAPDVGREVGFHLRTPVGDRDATVTVSGGTTPTRAGDDTSVST